MTDLEDPSDVLFEDIRQDFEEHIDNYKIQMIKLNYPSKEIDAIDIRIQTLYELENIDPYIDPALFRTMLNLPNMIIDSETLNFIRIRLTSTEHSRMALANLGNLIVNTRLDDRVDYVISDTFNKKEGITIDDVTVEDISIQPHDNKQKKGSQLGTPAKHLLTLDIFIVNKQNISAED